MIDINEIDIDIEYTFSSGLGSIEEHRYIKNVISKIYTGGYFDNSNNELVGITEFTILSLDKAKADHFDILQIFDHTEYTYRLGNMFYDFKRADFKQEFYSFYDHDLMNENICFLERMCLKPGYRGHNIGSKIFKDLVTNFYSQASIFVIQPYPLQFDQTSEDEGWNETYGLKMFPKNEQRSVDKLFDLYQSWGFQKIPGIKDIMFFNAERKNVKFESISLEE